MVPLLSHNLPISHTAADLSGVPWGIEPFRGFLRFRFNTCGSGTYENDWHDGVEKPEVGQHTGRLKVNLRIESGPAQHVATKNKSHGNTYLDAPYIARIEHAFAPKSRGLSIASAGVGEHGWAKNPKAGKAGADQCEAGNLQIRESR